MSFGQQNRTTESWNSDPNSFSNTSGPDAGFQNQRGNWNDNQQSQWGSHRPTHDPTVTSSWNNNINDQTGRRDFGDNSNRSGGNPQPGEGQFWSAGPGENYGTTGHGETTDANTFGTGTTSGNYAQSAGRHGGGAGVDGDNWRQGNNNWDNNNGPTPGAGKTSIGERLKGNAEKLAGRVTGNPSMVERGQVRKSGNPDDTNWNSNDY
ncbi:hypothetical protein C8Q77DRAFT_1158905 [Trametes polyzona]|nr:hypothetical protein C8Q77DRAFT_1158905 [Trametes polyzona]